MISNSIVLGIFFLFQTGFGVLGNSFLLGLYIITFFTGSGLRPIDLLFCHLAFVNNLVLLSKGIPQTMAALGLKNFLDDVGCKLVFYFHLVARGLSLCTTCLLSGFQAIILSSKSSRYAKFKTQAPKYIVPICFLCWTLHLLINCIILLYLKGSRESKNITERQDFIYCSVSFDSSFNVEVCVFIMSIPDALCVGIMVGTSGYLFLILYRHHQRVQYIHSNNLTSSSSPETKATQNIILLVSMYVLFYSLNSILVFHMQLEKPTFWLVHISAFLAACFPACSPFVLIVSDSQVLKYFSALLGRIRLLVQQNSDRI